MQDSRIGFTLPLLAALALAACNKTADLNIATVGDTMAYDQTVLTVKSGQKVHLTLKNNATLPVMPHNWVLVKPGTEKAVAEAGQAAGESAGFVPLLGDVLAHTEQAKPGQTAEATFTAPDPGKYPYICTNPGHYATMKGELVVTP